MKRTTLSMTLALAVCAASAQEVTTAPSAAVQETPAPLPQVAQDAAAEVASGQVLVIGQRPGPGMWKVSKGGHVLWIFALYGPLPQKLEWRSHQVESAIAQSQEFMHMPSGGTSVGVLKGLTLLPHLVGLKKNPGGATLQEVLPPPVYARWQSMKAVYIGENAGIERERPVFAAQTLYRAGLQRAGLASGNEVQKAVYALAKKYNIKKSGVNIQVDVDPATLIKDFKKSSLDDVRCLSDTMERLEKDMDTMRTRANAWARGNIAVIEQTNFADRERSCDDAMKSSTAFKNSAEFTTLGARLQTAWVEQAERALAANKSTFALLSMYQVLQPDGALAVLASKGYTVEKPE